MPYVVVLPHFHGDPETLKTFLSATFPQESKDISVLPLMPNEHQTVAVNVPMPKGEAKEGKRFRMSKAQLAWLDDIIFNLIKNNGPIAGRTLIERIRVHHAAITSPMMRNSIKRLEEEGLVEMNGKFYSALVTV